ncbi:hypothetical protein pipiens_003723 [Culex pipiens pipiens]|uniref:C2H2-type domain-containing protein n=1 Tax=Culex pipiens pipiens TaxID=38569 RepID=A0ABD1CTW6_CULPP
MSITVKNEPIIVEDDDDYDYDKMFNLQSFKHQPEDESQNPDLFCALCLRQRTSTSKFYEYQSEDCSTFCEYIRDLLGLELNLHHLYVCMPCCKMVEMVDSFKQCCLKARGWMDRVGGGLKCEDEWFTEETYQTIERIDETIRIHSEQLEPAGSGIQAGGYLGGENVDQDVISINSDDEDETDFDTAKYEPEPAEFPYGIAIEMDNSEDIYYIESSNSIAPVMNSQERMKVRKRSYTTCKCDICGAILSSKFNLKEHLFIHGEATQQCKFCDKRFKQRTNLLRHHRKKHSDIPSRNLYPPPEHQL